MKLKLEVFCAKCGKEKVLLVEPLRDGVILSDQAIDRAGWLSQQNGENFDIYCSKRCAA